MIVAKSFGEYKILKLILNLIFFVTGKPTKSSPGYFEIMVTVRSEYFEIIYTISRSLAEDLFPRNFRSSTDMVLHNGRSINKTIQNRACPALRNEHHIFERTS